MEEEINGTDTQRLKPSQNRNNPSCQDCNGNCQVCGETRELPENYRPANAESIPEGRACGNCIFYREDKQNEEGLSYCKRWDDYVRGDYYCNAWEPKQKQEKPLTSRMKLENLRQARGNGVSKIETRVNTVEFEIREESDGMMFSGYAAVFDSPSEPLPFIETIQRGAFRKSLRSRNDIKFLWNHDSGEILGSTRAKTIQLIEDERGLKIEGSLPNTSRGRDVAELLKRGDVDSMSFGFSVPSGGDTWSSDGSERILKSVRLHEVSLVAFPAYAGTTGLQAVRGLDKVAERTGVDAEALADALLKIEDGSEISGDEKEMLSRVIADLGPEEVVEETPAPDLTLLNLKKKKLELLSKGLY